MKTSTFLSFTLLLFSVFMAAHGLFRANLTDVPLLEDRVEQVEREKEEADFRAQLAAHQLADYQQQVATLLPDAIKTRASDEAATYPLRQIASVVGAKSQLSIERASSLHEKGKAAFRDAEYEKSNQIFDDLISRYPESVHVIEAHFLLAEGQYQLKEYEASVQTIERMIDLFPESELTGFALLRLGRVFQIQDRLEDAGDIYKSVLNNFKEPELQKQARASLKEVQL